MLMTCIRVLCTLHVLLHVIFVVAPCPFGEDLKGHFLLDTGCIVIFDDQVVSFSALALLVWSSGL